ncbi:MAG TPA: ABC transporter permease subunit [Lachnospiraceae bacterium]|nr:ABC transporter permease subunit [Lachnospiraceae bacterium]
MIAIVKREIKNYLKRPLFGIGVILVILGVFLNLEPYLTIQYVSSEKEQAQNIPEVYYDGDISEGYVPTSEEQRREMWEEMICESLISISEMNKVEAESVIEKMKGMDIEKACEYLEKEYHFEGAIHTYWDTRYHQGTKEEMNSYIESKLQKKSFSYYFSRKFADFAGLYMAFFASVMLAVLFLQDTKKNTYELLHTKPVRAGTYVFGKIAGGFSVCLIVLAILNLVFFIACRIFTGSSGFEVRFTDFVVATCLYILPNMLMIVCVHGLVSLLFKNPLPAVPFLILYMVYSNMGSRNAEGMFGYYGRPLAIMVRFPGQFFETTPPPMSLLNQSFLLLASIGIIMICVQLWRRRRI